MIDEIAAAMLSRITTFMDRNDGKGLVPRVMEAPITMQDRAKITEIGTSYYLNEPEEDTWLAYQRTIQKIVAVLEQGAK